MIQLLTMPPWEGLHPAIVHFPIALLLIVPYFLLWGMAFKRTRRAAWGAGLAVCVLGTMGAIVATITGEASAEALHVPVQLRVFVEGHEDAGELARNLFVILALLYAVVLGFDRYGERFMKTRPSEKLTVTLMAIYFLLYVGGCAALVNAAARGGELVHLHGIRAPMGRSEISTPDIPKAKGIDSETREHEPEKR
jgi:uncharacterized membrane protein